MRQKPKPLPSQEELQHFLNYDPETGLFFWKNPLGTRVNPGDAAGSLSNYGYFRISINDNDYQAHRLAWCYHYGEDPGELQVDHINGVRSDNRIANLRLATNTQNGQNKSSKGFYLHKATGKWCARIVVDGKPIYLGLYECPLLARLAFEDAAKKYFGAFARV